MLALCEQGNSGPLTAGSGTGTLEGARGGSYATLNGVALTGEYDIFGTAWNGPAWATATRNQTAWQVGVWMTHELTGNCWCGTSFAGAGNTWLRSTWGESSWTRSSWSGSGWLRSTWRAGTWTNGGW